MSGVVPDGARFDNRVAQRVMIGFSLLILLIGLGGLSAPESRGQGVFFAALGVASLVRAVRSSRVEVDAAGVTTRSMLRTRRHSFEDLSTVEVVVGRTGLNGFDREYLVFHHTDGAAVAFKELNCRPSPGEVTVVQRAAACIRERLPRAGVEVTGAGPQPRRVGSPDPPAAGRAAMGADWIRSARALAESISEFTHVVPDERWLTDRLLEFVFEPNDPAAARMELLTSSDQMFFFAGLGTRFELDGPDRAADEVREIARSVATGGLTERVRRRRVRFVVDLGDGKEASGSSSLRKDRQDEAPGIYRYSGYPGVG